MALHPQLHKAIKHAALISYSNDDLLDKGCAIPCKRCCTEVLISFLLRLSCLSVNQLLQPPQKYKLPHRHQSQRQGVELLLCFANQRAL